MSESEWRVASASVVGTSHIATGAACQDEHRIEIYRPKGHPPTLIACVADGAGSAQYGGIGARIACRTWVKRARHGIRHREIATNYGNWWIHEVRRALKAKASSDGIPLREYACTFLGAYVQDDRAMYVQLGDGAIVVGKFDEANDYELIFWPDQGEYANVTCFLTDEDADVRIQTSVRVEKTRELALFSDGLQRLALSYEARTAFKPFFDSMFSHLRLAQDEQDPLLSQALHDLLSSEAFNERTDDDKSLILATRA